MAGRWLFAVALAVSALVVSGSAQAQGAGYFEVLPPAGTSLDPALAARWAKGVPAGCGEGGGFLPGCGVLEGVGVSEVACGARGCGGDAFDGVPVADGGRGVAQ